MKKAGDGLSAAGNGKKKLLATFLLAIGNGVLSNAVTLVYSIANRNWVEDLKHLPGDITLADALVENSPFLLGCGLFLALLSLAGLAAWRKGAPLRWAGILLYMMIYFLVFCIITAIFICFLERIIII